MWERQEFHEDCIKVGGLHVLRCIRSFDVDCIKALSAGGSAEVVNSGGLGREDQGEEAEA